MIPPWHYPLMVTDPEIKRLAVRLPREVYDAVRAAARRNRRSINAEAITLLETALRQQESAGIS